jgi:hypothetical protein
MHGMTLSDDRCQAGAVNNAWYAELADGSSVTQPAAVLDEERAHAQA